MDPSDLLRRKLEREKLARQEVEKIIEEKSAELYELNQNLEKALLEQEQIAKELVIKNEQAEAANQAKSVFLANTSHELRTPLNAIIGLSEMLYEDATDAGDHKYIESLDRINKAGKHLLQIINNILDLSKIESGKLEIFIEDLQINDLLKDIEALAGTLASKNHNTFSTRLSGSFDIIQTDAVKLKQILLNLIGNACKFTENGQVILEAIQNDEETIIFRVIDTGIGMNEEELKHVFEEFVQADSSITRKYGGTGLGLTITLKLCHMIGGDITMESEKGKGTTCIVKIPTHMSKELKSSAIKKEPLLQIKTNCSLVIENDPEVAGLIKKILEEEGFKVYVAETGEDGLKIANEVKPSLIVLDLYFHDKTQGWQILNSLKSSPITQNSAILVIGTHKEENLSFVLGATDYVTKPVDKDQIIKILNRHTSKKSVNKIIVIDDNEDTRKQFRRILEKENCQILEASDGVLGLALLNQEKPDLIFLDLMMPNMDGFEFLETIRKKQEYLSIPVIIITAKTLEAEDYARLAGKTRQILQKGEYTADAIKLAVKGVIAATKKME